MFRSAEGVLPGYRGRTKQTPVLSLWSVLGGQAGREEELRTEHLPSPGPTGGPGQVRPHVGPISAFSSDSGLVLSFPAGLQRGGTRSCQGKGEHYKGARRGLPTPQLGGGTSQSPPLLPAQKAQGYVSVYPPGVPSMSLTGAPGTRR